MPKPTESTTERRYQGMAEQKSAGATYTPPRLAEFVASEIAREASGLFDEHRTVRILDPGVGDGELLFQLLEKLGPAVGNVEVHGFDTNQAAAIQAEARLRTRFPSIGLEIHHADFLEFAVSHLAGSQDLFSRTGTQLKPFDLVIANPPYVRTQILGAEQAQALARRFSLNGRVDLYSAFLVAIAGVLDVGGVAGIIVSNRFMTTKAGASVRSSLRRLFGIRGVWDLGDTKLFDAAVLPAVLLLRGSPAETSEGPAFGSIYETTSEGDETIAAVGDPIDALSHSGSVRLADGRTFSVQHGSLDLSGPLDGVWRLSTESKDSWLEQVARNTWRTFGGIGKIRVGVKTCADPVFIRKDWDELGADDRPELLRPLTTHHAARRFRAQSQEPRRWILYPHVCENGKRMAADLSKFPKSRRYLETHRERLEQRTYVMESGRSWFEIWVPQDPDLWSEPKLILRDITDAPCFWLDFDGSVVNGDCYWLTAEKSLGIDVLWLAAAVGNSTFVEAFYDHRFNNKLYSGRRRFITQYVEQFPLPDPSLPSSQRLISTARALYEKDDPAVAAELDTLVWHAFGFTDHRKIEPAGGSEASCSTPSLEIAEIA